MYHTLSTSSMSSVLSIVYSQLVRSIELPNFLAPTSPQFYQVTPHHGTNHRISGSRWVQTKWSVPRATQCLEAISDAHQMCC